MASNTRGRIKERFVGIHKNLDWCEVHCQECLKLIADKNPAMTKAIKALSKGCHTLDGLTQEIYGKL